MNIWEKRRERLSIFKLKSIRWLAKLVWWSSLLPSRERERERERQSTIMYKHKWNTNLRSYHSCITSFTKTSNRQAIINGNTQNQYAYVCVSPATAARTQQQQQEELIKILCLLVTEQKIVCLMMMIQVPNWIIVNNITKESHHHLSPSLFQL